jgi:cobalt-zinc-cadmium efflux system protein
MPMQDENSETIKVRVLHTEGCANTAPTIASSMIDALREKIRHQLLRQFGIDHPVLQFETGPCGEGKMPCALSCGSAPAGAAGNSESSPVRCFLTQRSMTLWIRLFLGAVFVIASVDKIFHPAAFAQAIYNYQILPDELINLTAIILPWLELLLGILLIAGRWLPGATVLVNLLLLTFFGALVFNVARGLDVHCGCFTSSTEGTPAITWYLIRDSVFLVLGCTLTYRVIFRPQAREGVATASQGGSKPNHIL